MPAVPGLRASPISLHRVFDSQIVLSHLREARLSGVGLAATVITVKRVAIFRRHFRRWQHLANTHPACWVSHLRRCLDRLRVIMAEASLSFLGMLVRAGEPSGDGRTHMEVAPWLALWPGLCLTVVVYVLNMFGDAMRDLLDPRLRGGEGRLDADAARSVK